VAVAVLVVQVVDALVDLLCNSRLCFSCHGQTSPSPGCTRGY
jgi:hypothetical protein